MACLLHFARTRLVAGMANVSGSSASVASRALAFSRLEDARTRPVVTNTGEILGFWSQDMGGESIRERLKFNERGLKLFRASDVQVRI
jgi:hypothetical protein